jgi:hypothetical protein
MIRLKVCAIISAMLLLALRPIIAAAGDWALYDKPSGYSILGSIGNGQPSYGETTDGPANWTIAQWSNPATLGGFHQEGAARFVSHSATDDVSVMLRGDLNVRIEQDGRTQPCTRPNGRPLENDLFVQPAARLDPHTQPYAILGNMSALRVGGQFQNVRMWTTAAQPACQVNQGAALIAIIINNTAVHPAQVLFYQLHLAAVCPPGIHPACSTNFKPHFYSSGTRNGQNAEFGYDDNISAFGEGMVESSGPQSLNFDFIPRLKAVLAEGSSSGLDQNLSHWWVSGMYLGQSIWGRVGFATSWRGFVPQVSMK